MDFTIKTYQELLEALIAHDYTFQTLAGFLERPEPRSIILRHDVEARYLNALAFARIQHEYKIRGHLFFQVPSESFQF